MHAVEFGDELQDGGTCPAPLRDVTEVAVREHFFGDM
jgi:hypothetical protein